MRKLNFLITFLLLIFSSTANAAEKIIRTEGFGMSWDSPWSLTRLVLLGVLTIVTYLLIRSSLFPYLLDPDKDVKIMPRTAFKITICVFMFVWVSIFIVLFSLFPGQELRVSSNIIPGAKSFVIIQYVDMRWFYFLIIFLIIMLIFSVLVPSGKLKSKR